MQFPRTLTAILAIAIAPLVAHSVATAAPPQEIDDADITLAVNAELHIEDGVPSAPINVSTENGVVTLTGTVDTYYARYRATDVAESVKGVIGVINNLHVRPVAREDELIRTDIVRALATDPATESFEIDVTVENGVVTLTGEVDSYTERMLAEETVQDIKGVSSISNELVYEIDTDRADAEILGDIKGRLKEDASIDAGLIHTTVDGGVVTLSGSVQSAAEKSAAAAEAWAVAGVTDVVNALDVQWWRAEEMGEYDSQWSDMATQQAIESALTLNPRVRGYNIEVIVDDGVATLSGTVTDLQARAAAEQEALDTLGVWKVNNKITVRPAVSRTDAEIAEDIRDQLQQSPYIDWQDIIVTVNNGTAFLQGEASSWFERNQAESVASTVPGITTIDNDIDVDYVPAAKTDTQLKDDIQSQLWWSPFVDSDNIVVDVNQGVATLTGVVEDWNDVRVAEENAQQAGATDVINRLEVSGNES